MYFRQQYTKENAQLSLSILTNSIADAEKIDKDQRGISHRSQRKGGIFALTMNTFSSACIRARQNTHSTQHHERDIYSYRRHGAQDARHLVRRH
jgi:hypothetical protein